MKPFNNSFSIERFYQLCYRYLFMYWQRVVIAFGVVAAIVVISYTLPLMYMPNEQLVNRISTVGFNAALSTCIMFYILGGLLFSSHIFNELHNKEKAFQFLLLPASSTEKFSSAWFMTVIGYTLFSVGALFLLSVVIEGLIVYKTAVWTGFSVFNPFEPQFLRAVIFMVIFQSVFLLGGIYFRSYHFVKTLFSLLIFFFFMLLMGIPVLIDFVAGQQIIQHNTTMELTSPVLYGVGMLITLVLMGLAYVMFKRKQIA